MKQEEKRLIDEIFDEYYYKYTCSNCDRKHNGEHDEDICNYVNR